CQQVYSIPLTF
nr:immunoglobulin light chain junction region [Macaca mulatta]MOX99507.1 immunoglobulin light chain junction region [Macaca mulatta]